MQIDHKAFKFRASIDWCDLCITTSEPSQAKHIHAAARGAFSHVNGINQQSGKRFSSRYRNTTTSCFVVRIQAPERFASLIDALCPVRQKIAPGAPILVLGMEISFDALLAVAQENPKVLLAEMTAHLVKGVNKVSPAHPRLYRKKNETRQISTLRDLTQALEDGFQVGIGNGQDARYQHAYLKTTDAGSELAVDDWRARLEIRLQGDACPVKTLDELATHNFAEQSDFFRFRDFANSEDAFTRMVYEKSISLGNVLQGNGALVRTKRAEGGTRANKRGTNASPINELARYALRDLSRRWARQSRSAARAHTTAPCANPGHCEQPPRQTAGRQMISTQMQETPEIVEPVAAPLSESSAKPLGVAMESLNTSYLPEYATQGRRPWHLQPATSTPKQSASADPTAEV